MSNNTTIIRERWDNRIDEYVPYIWTEGDTVCMDPGSDWASGTLEHNGFKWNKEGTYMVKEEDENYTARQIAIIVANGGAGSTRSAS